MRALTTLTVVALVCSAGLSAQTRRPPARQPAPTTAAPASQALRTEPAVVKCPEVLGIGVQTKRTFCDVLIGSDPAAGIIVTLPPHTGEMTLTFDLHNRHTYSEELVKTRRAYSRYTATVGVLAPDVTLLARAIVQNEFRTVADLFDRITGGTGPGGLKAVAPTASEPVAIVIPARETSPTVSILGEKLSVLRIDADNFTTPDTFTTPGRPIALVSNVMVQYRPAPARRAPAPRRR